MHFNLVITEKCNLTCKHCMYSCTQHGKTMPDDVIVAAYEFAKEMDKKAFLEFGFYGGEALLELDTLEKAVEIFYQKTNEPDEYRRCSLPDTFYIPTNGILLQNKDVRKQLCRILDKVSASGTRFTEPFCISVSDTYWHDESMKEKGIYEKFYNFMKELSESKDKDDKDLFNFLDFRFKYGVQFKESDNKNGFNYTGRAREFGLEFDKQKPLTCILSGMSICHIDTEEELYENDYFSQDIEIWPNGDISCCCSAKGAIIGNVVKEHMTSELFFKRLQTLLSELNMNGKDTYDMCEKCREYNLTKQ